MFYCRLSTSREVFFCIMFFFVSLCSFLFSFHLPLCPQPQLLAVDSVGDVFLLKKGSFFPPSLSRCSEDDLVVAVFCLILTVVVNWRSIKILNLIVNKIFQNSSKTIMPLECYELSQKKAVSEPYTGCFCQTTWEVCPSIILHRSFRLLFFSQLTLFLQRH